jgi:hypothetical protein
MEISYTSECDVDYVSAVKTCKTLPDLKKIVRQYREIAGDALAAVNKMDTAGFIEFRKGRNRSKPSAEWMENYGMILLPATILKAGLVAEQFKVPFGCAYHRLKDLGLLEKEEKK